MIDVNYITDVLYGGVDFTLPGNGGKECAAFLSSKQRVLETVIYELFTCFVLWQMLGKVSVPEKLPAYREGTGIGKRLLLVVHCLIFGIEIGFKFATKQVIFLLNPCHVLTAIQVSLSNLYRCVAILPKRKKKNAAARFKTPQVKGLVHSSSVKCNSDSMQSCSLVSLIKFVLFSCHN